MKYTIISSASSWIGGERYANTKAEAITIAHERLHDAIRSYCALHASAEVYHSNDWEQNKSNRGKHPYYEIYPIWKINWESRLNRPDLCQNYPYGIGGNISIEKTRIKKKQL